MVGITENAKLTICVAGFVCTLPLVYLIFFSLYLLVINCSDKEEKDDTDETNDKKMDINEIEDDTDAEADGDEKNDEDCKFDQKESYEIDKGENEEAIIPLEMNK